MVLEPSDLMNNSSDFLFDPINPNINDLTLPRNNLRIFLNNNDDYISDEEFDANPVPIRYFNNGIEFDDSN